MAVLLSLSLGTSAIAADDPVLAGLVEDIEAASADIEAELAAINSRIVSDDSIIFASDSRVPVQVDLAAVRRWLPLVQSLRGSSLKFRRSPPPAHSLRVCPISGGRPCCCLVRRRPSWNVARMPSWRGCVTSTHLSKRGGAEACPV